MRNDNGFPPYRQSEEDPRAVEDMQVEGVDQTEHLEDPTTEGFDQQTSTHADQGTTDQTLVQTDERESQTDQTSHREESNNCKICSEPGTIDQGEPRLSQVDQVPDDDFDTRLLVISQLVKDLYHFREFEEFKCVSKDKKQPEEDHEECIYITGERNPLLERINQVDHICKKFYRDYAEMKKGKLVVDPLMDIGNFPSHVSKEIDMEEQIGAISKEKSDERLIGYQFGGDNENRHCLKYKELISYYNFLDKKKLEYQGVLESRMFKMATKYLELLYEERDTPYSETMEKECMKRLDEYEKQRDEVVREIKRIVDETTAERPRYLASLDKEFKSGDEQKWRSKLEERNGLDSTIERLNWLIEESRKAADNRCENSIKQIENDNHKPTIIVRRIFA